MEKAFKIMDSTNSKDQENAGLDSGRTGNRAPSVNFHSIADLIRPANNEESTRGKTTSPNESLSTENCGSDGEKSRSTPPPSDKTSVANASVVSPSLLPTRNDGELPVSPQVEDSLGEQPLERRDTQPATTMKKGRTIYKAQQVYVLEHIFQRTHYPDPEVIETLSQDLNIGENKIKVWFQNKRARWRRRVNDTPAATISVSTPPTLLQPPPSTWHIRSCEPAFTSPSPRVLFSPPRALSSPYNTLTLPPNIAPPLLGYEYHQNLDSRKQTIDIGRVFSTPGHSDIMRSNNFRSNPFSESSLQQLRKTAQDHCSILPGNVLTLSPTNLSIYNGI